MLLVLYTIQFNGCILGLGQGTLGIDEILKVRYKRKKYDIDMLGLTIEQTLKNKDLNYESKLRIMSIDNLNMISKAITHFSFRNGPIEACMQEMMN
jgi:hypothetical protein